MKSSPVVGKREELIAQRWQKKWDDRAYIAEWRTNYAKMRPVHQAMAEDIKEKLGLQKDDVMLEIGCGDGFMLSYLAQFVHQAYGADFAAHMLAQGPKAANIDYLLAEASKIPFAENSFDKVFAQNMFNCFPTYSWAEKVLLEMIRVCKPGGTVLVSDLPPAAERRLAERRSPLRYKLMLPIYNLYRLIKFRIFKFALVDLLYYERSFFNKFSQKYGYDCSCVEQNRQTKEAKIKRDRITIYRYDVIIRK